MQKRCFFLFIFLSLGMSNWASAIPKLLVQVNRAGIYDIGVLDADGKNFRLLTDTRKEAEYSAVWSPNGRQIAFAISKHVMLMDADGKNVRNFTEPLGLVPAQDPAWSPDGKSLAFTVPEDPNFTTWNIHVANLDGSNVQKLTHIAGKENRTPVWSPDGGKIAYVSIETVGGKRTSSEIFVMDASGENQRQLTKKALDFSPTWSPDGEKIAYYHRDDNPLSPSQLWVMDADGGNPHRLTIPFNIDKPLWLPDGRILFKRFGSNETYTIDPDGQNLTLLFDLKDVDGTVTVTSWFDPARTRAVFLQGKQPVTLGHLKAAALVK